MRSLKQHIIHKNKIPSDYRTGQPANAHDPAVWATYDEAARAAAFYGPGYGVGFVFTAADPYWFLDIDKCREGDNWSSTALELCAKLTGCYVEVSLSGHGLHIVGTGVAPPHACRNKAHGLEFYTEGRYMALGHSGQGNPEHDATLALAGVISEYFPDDGAGHSSGWQEGHELGWELPGDDELIQVAERMGGASVVFGGKASFKQLWTADTDALAKHFDGDRSAADMALASKLAWLTGNDCPRIEALMRRSGLMRDKWDQHPTYLQGFTIPRALVRDGGFYDPQYARRRAEQKQEMLRLTEESEQLPECGEMSVEGMTVRYAYIVEGKRVIDLECPRYIWTLDEWKAAYKSSKSFTEVKGEFKADGSPKLRSMEHTRIWEDHPKRLKVPTVTFRPGSPIRTVDPEGKEAVNMWRPIARVAADADISRFTDHVRYLFGADAERFLDWLAHIEQNPGDLPHTGWVHISPMHGTGRNWFTPLFFQMWKGHVSPAFDLAGTLKNGYNGNLSMKLLAMVDEINEGGSTGRWDNAEALKSIVTPSYRNINPKFGYQRMEYNCCRWLIFSNHDSALPLTAADRRFNVVKNSYPPHPPEYYVRLYGALKEPGFVESVAWFLRCRDISGFNPGAHAAHTAAREELIAASKSEVDEAIDDLIKHHPCDIITNAKLGQILTGQMTGKLTPHHRHALQRAGIVPYPVTVRLESGPGRVSILRNHAVWKAAEADQVRDRLKSVTR